MKVPDTAGPLVLQLCCIGNNSGSVFFFVVMCLFCVFLFQELKDAYWLLRGGEWERRSTGAAVQNIENVNV